MLGHRILEAEKVSDFISAARVAARSGAKGWGWVAGLACDAGAGVGDGASLSWRCPVSLPGRGIGAAGLQVGAAGEIAGSVADMDDDEFAI